MKALPLLVLTAIICVTPLSAQSSSAAPETETIQKQIEANEQAVNRAIHARDFSALEKFWSPMMVVNNPANAIFTRDDVISSMKRGGLNYSTLKGYTESFRIFGDIAVEMGHEDFVMAAGPAAGKPLVRRYTNVWQRTGGEWVQIARQATILNVDAAWVYGSPSTASAPQLR